MACFLVPAGEAVVTSIMQRFVGKEMAERLKLSWLNLMLWGGVIILAIEHIWHGEISPLPPFLTAMRDPSEIGVMLHEMATNGTMMAFAVTVVWVAMVLISVMMERRSVRSRSIKVE